MSPKVFYLNFGAHFNLFLSFHNYSSARKVRSTIATGTRIFKKKLLSIFIGSFLLFSLIFPLCFLCSKSTKKARHGKTGRRPPFARAAGGGVARSAACFSQTAFRRRHRGQKNSLLRLLTASRPRTARTAFVLCPLSRRPLLRFFIVPFFRKLPLLRVVRRCCSLMRTKRRNNRFSVLFSAFFGQLKIALPRQCSFILRTSNFSRRGIIKLT